ncbi:hypothetical protein SPHV1_2310006 [Novosphingobium sp. KN65.2]|nr:hypothetical protein SPHV1_2310006 [Novosphingobium sp. KN65.2]
MMCARSPRTGRQPGSAVTLGPVMARMPSIRGGRVWESSMANAVMSPKSKMGALSWGMAKKQGFGESFAVPLS